jgi:membrane peptidoglycan carboxypeptidase
MFLSRVSKRYIVMTELLRGAAATETGRRAVMPGSRIGGKTGTSQYSLDERFTGFEGNTIAEIWFGNDVGAPMRGVTGGGLAASMWQQFMAPGLWRFAFQPRSETRAELKVDWRSWGGSQTLLSKKW